MKNLPGVGGIMLWDVSWDQNNVIGGQRYSEYAFKELGGLTNTVPPVTSQAPPPPVTTQAPPPPGTTQAPPPPTGECRNNVLFCTKCISTEVKAASENKLTNKNKNLMPHFHQMRLR